MPSQLFTASGTWTKPEGVTQVTVECIGAGCAGASSSGPAEGGGGGDYARKASIDVSGSSSFSVTVGVSGGAVDSYFDSGFEVYAAGSIDRYGGSNGTSSGDVIYDGGDGGAGGMNSGDGGGGGGGGGGGTAAGGFGNDGTEFNGGTGGTGGAGGGTWLTGGNGGNGAFGGNGGIGNGYGSGGGGGSPGHGGPGNGADGAVQIHWTSAGDPDVPAEDTGRAWWLFLSS